MSPAAKVETLFAKIDEMMGFVVSARVAYPVSTAIHVNRQELLMITEYIDEGVQPSLRRKAPHDKSK